MTTQPTSVVSARTAVSVELTSPSSAVELALMRVAQKAPATKTKKMYDFLQLLLQ